LNIKFNFSLYLLNIYWNKGKKNNIFKLTKKMAKFLHFKLGRYNFPLIYENMTLKPTGFFSNLSPIHIHKKIEMSEIIERILDGIDIKKFHMISMDVPQKKQKQEKLSLSKEEKEETEENDPSDCRKLVDRIDNRPLLGEGVFGEVRLWREDIAVKDEKCSFFNEENDKPKEDKKFFLTVQKEKKEIAEHLADEGITPRIYAVTRCGNHCLTFMDSIDGETLHEILLRSDPTALRKVFNFFKEALFFKNSKRYLFPSDNSKDNKYKLIEISVKLIKRFHSVMKRIGYDNLGHGDLHQGNIMLPYKDPLNSMKIIDLSFERKKTFKYDFDFFFKKIRQFAGRYGLDIEEIDKIQFNSLNEMIPLETYKSEEIEKRNIDYESPFKVYNTCKNFMNEMFKIKPFETGSNDSEIRIWNEKTKIKMEDCSDLDIHYPDEDYLKLEKEKIQIIGILANEEITPRIYEIAKCGHRCITIMEIFEGKTLGEIMEDTSIDKIFKYNLIIKVSDVIKKFHETMKKNGYNFGHGNLFLSNILINMKSKNEMVSSARIRLVDFNFIRRVEFDEDWTNFFNVLKFYYLDARIVELLERDYME